MTPINSDPNYVGFCRRVDHHWRRLRVFRHPVDGSCKPALRDRFGFHFPITGQTASLRRFGRSGKELASTFGRRSNDAGCFVLYARPLRQHPVRVISRFRCPRILCTVGTASRHVKRHRKLASVCPADRDPYICLVSVKFECSVIYIVEQRLGL